MQILQNNLNSICPKFTETTASQTCLNTFIIYNHKLPILQRKFNEISQLLNHTPDFASPRKRRALDFLGTIWKYIAGSPDASDAEYYDSAIRETQADQQKLETLLKEQLQIVSSTISNFNLTISSLQNYTKTLNANAEKLNKLSSKVTRNEVKMEIFQIFYKLSNQLEILAETLEIN